MQTKQISTKTIIIFTLMVWVSTSSCAWQGRYYIVNDSSSEILFVNNRLGESNLKDYCLLKKGDTIHYRSNDDCFKIAQFSEMTDDGVYSTVIPPNYILYMGKSPLPYSVNWLVKDPDTNELIDDLNDLNKWHVHPKKFISFRRVFIYEVTDKNMERNP